MPLTQLKVVVFTGDLGPVAAALLVKVLKLFQTLHNQTSLVALEIGLGHGVQVVGEQVEECFDSRLEVFGRSLTLNDEPEAIGC